MSFLHEDFSIEERLYAKAIGYEVIQWAKEYNPSLLSGQVHTDAILLIKEIQSILNDETLNDPDCFYRIAAIISAFDHAGLTTTRHWETE